MEVINRANAFGETRILWGNQKQQVQVNRYRDESYQLDIRVSKTY